MASHDLSNTKTIILGATSGAIPGTDGNPRERFSFAPAFSEHFFSRIGVVPAGQTYRNCLKYVQSNSVPSRLLPNGCLLNLGRGTPKI